MFNNKVSLLYVIVSSALCSVLTYAICYNNFKHYKPQLINTASAASLSVVSSPASAASCGSVTHRLQGFEFVKPILYGDKTCETGNYSELKAELNKTIDQFKQQGIIDNASVYLKILTSGGEYISINENELFHPGSLIKLPILITYMKMEENEPGLLNRKIQVEAVKGIPKQTYNSHQVEIGKSYTIHELLKYMVAFSDNNATYLLNKNVDLVLFKKVFTDLGLSEPDVHDPNFSITAKDYSAFLKVIYNAAYLSITHSEYVAELLSQCDFKEGLQKGLPSDVKIAHKFGEWGDAKNPAIHQLSESGIVYLNGTQYLLTVMTQGKFVNKLPDVISVISSKTFNTLKEKI